MIQAWIYKFRGKFIATCVAIHTIYSRKARATAYQQEHVFFVLCSKTICGHVEHYISGKSISIEDMTNISNLLRITHFTLPQKKSNSHFREFKELEIQKKNALKIIRNKLNTNNNKMYLGLRLTTNVGLRIKTKNNPINSNSEVVKYCFILLHTELNEMQCQKPPLYT